MMQNNKQGVEVCKAGGSHHTSISVWFPYFLVLFSPKTQPNAPGCGFIVGWGSAAGMQRPIPHRGCFACGWAWAGGWGFGDTPEPQLSQGWIWPSAPVSKLRASPVAGLEPRFWVTSSIQSLLCWGTPSTARGLPSTGSRSPLSPSSSNGLSWGWVRPRCCGIPLLGSPQGPKGQKCGGMRVSAALASEGIVRMPSGARAVLAHICLCCPSPHVGTQSAVTTLPHARTLFRGCSSP